MYFVSNEFRAFWLVSTFAMHVFWYGFCMFPLLSAELQAAMGLENKRNTWEVEVTTIYFEALLAKPTNLRRERERGRDRETSKRDSWNEFTAAPVLLVVSNLEEQSKRGSLTESPHPKYKGRIQSSWGYHTAPLIGISSSWIIIIPNILGILGRIAYNYQ